MKLLEIKHYVEHSFEDKPSFVLLMSDNKEYISNGCVFVERTDENAATLIDRYDCASELDALFQSKGIALHELVDARHMFYGCKNLREFSGDMPSLVDARLMFRGCKNLREFSGDMPSLVDARSMFRGCENLVLSN
jgi:hypothetical protein